MQERDVVLEPWFSITVASGLLGEDMLKYVSEIEVVSEEEKLPQAFISVSDYDKKWLNADFLGKENYVTIRMGHRKNNASLFRGKISFVDADYPEEGIPSLVITCTGISVDMMKHRQSRVFKKMKLSDVIIHLHKESNLEVEVEDTKTIMPHIPMNKETALEFTHRWRSYLGWQYFEKPGGGFYFGRKRKEQFALEVLGYQKGNLAIKSFKPFFSDLEVEDNEEESGIDSSGKLVSSTTTTSRNTLNTTGTDYVVGKA